MTVEEIFYAMALTRLNGIGLIPKLQLYKQVGSAQKIFEYKNDIRQIVPDCSDRLVEAIKFSDESIEKTKLELDFAVKHQIQCLCYADEAYPYRLKECDDAPIVLYYKGSANLNQSKIISMVGTRQCTQYGKDLINRFFSNLKYYCPNVLVVSGLAYGIDVAAHRSALQNNYETVGVLAHGLDQIYPSSHRNTAIEMLQQGGLLTEYMSETNADKQNFVSRNRIVAGMSDATIVVESAAHGGSLITASLAQGYNRDVFAFPGSVFSEFSEGCNNLIRDNSAALVNNAEDFIHAMKWDDEKIRNEKKSKGIERSLFLELSSDEQAIVDLLQKTNDLQINILSVKTNLPINKITALLFQLEMKGVIKLLPGGVYHLLA